MLARRPIFLLKKCLVSRNMHTSPVFCRSHEKSWVLWSVLQYYPRLKGSNFFFPNFKFPGTFEDRGEWEIVDWGVKYYFRSNVPSFEKFPFIIGGVGSKKNGKFVSKTRKLCFAPFLLISWCCTVIDRSLSCGFGWVYWASKRRRGLLSPFMNFSPNLRLFSWSWYLLSPPRPLRVCVTAEVHVRLGCSCRMSAYVVQDMELHRSSFAASLALSSMDLAVLAMNSIVWPQTVLCSAFVSQFISCNFLSFITFHVFDPVPNLLLLLFATATAVLLQQGQHRGLHARRPGGDFHQGLAHPAPQPRASGESYVS